MAMDKAKLLKKPSASLVTPPSTSIKLARRLGLDAASTGLDEKYVPPFPWCNVTLTPPFKTKIVSGKRYIVTGSDESIVPAKIGEQLNLIGFPVMRMETDQQYC